MTIDLHVHTSEVSGCGKVPAAEMARMYHEKGYDAIVVTDHLIAGKNADMPVNERCAWYLSGWRAARAEGEKLDLVVLRGAEVRFTSGNEDFLLFGWREDELEGLFSLLDGGISEPEFYRYVHGTGRMLLIQAHPFRKGLRQAALQDLDGIEVYNGHPGHDSHNDLALALAEKGREGFIMTSGSDAHEPHHVARGGMITDCDIRTEDELVAWLRANPRGRRIETAF
ncbi:MAG: PHP domain-containing protein [Clostridia bacterium]|nr:PHP domain-containing protein [Clostridia bacterium]